MKQNKFLLKALILGFMAICIFASCKVGLGASIDTQKPLVSFVTPDPDATKKGTFTISGTASDDSDIRSVNINLVLNGESKYAYNATVNKAEGTWTLTVPTLGENGDILVDDGNYEFQVIATDIDGKTSSDKRAIRIDNSAPTVLVNSPSLFDENKSTFFRQLRVSGSAYDASEISNVKLYFYQEGEESLDYADTEKYAAFQAEGTNTWELSKDLTEADTFFKDNTVYNFFVVAEDIAGNKNTYFYRMGDFYNENVLKDTNPNDGDDYIPFPSMMQIGMLDQGKEVPNTTSGLTLEGLEKIQISCENNETNNSNILYRSESATSISWGNIEYDEDEEHNKYPRAIPLETDISGQLKSTDGTDILPNSVEIWIKKETTKKDINEDWWQVESENITLDSSGKTIAFNIVLKKDGEYLKSGNYLIMIKYQTVASSNLPILVSDAHQFAISAGMPVLTETSLSKLGSANTSVSNPINLQVSTNIDKVTISGKALKGDRTPVNSIDVILNGVSVESPSINQVDGTWSIELIDEGVYQYEFTVTDGNNTNTIHRTVIIDRTKPEITNVDFSQNQEKTEITLKAFIIETNAFNSIEYAFIEKENAEVDDLIDSDWHSAGTLSSMNIKLNSLDFAGTFEFAQGPWTLFVKAIDNASNEAIEKYTGVLDLDSPKFENFKSTSIPASGYLNTDFEYVIEDKEILASDNYKIKKIEIVAKKDGIVQSNFGYTKNLSKASITKADLNDLPVIEGKVENAGKWIITTTLYDLNDNKVEKTVDFTLDVTCPEIVISSYPQPENDNGATFDFKGTAEDKQSSISKIFVSLDKTTWKEIDGSKTWICELAIPTEGEGVVYAKAIDGAGNESAIVEQAFVFDKSRPSVAVTTNSGNPEWATGTNYTLEGTAEDSWLMSEDSPVTITQTKGTEKVTLTGVDYDATAKTWKVEGLPRKADNTTIASGNIETGTYVYTIVAKDKAGKTSEKKVTVQIDKDAPTVPEVISPNGNVDENAISVKTYRFQGNTEDIGSSATGVKQVEYKISESSTPETSGTTILASSGSWNFTQDFEEGKEGKKYLHIRSEDNAGNKSSWKTVEFDVDFSAPEVKVSENFKANEKAIFTLSGTATDTKEMAATNSVVVTQRDSAGKALTVTSTVTGNSWTTQSLPVIEEGKSVEAGNEAEYNGTYTYEIKATDWCGKTTTITKTVNFDTVAPELDIKNLKNGEFLAQEEIIIQGTVRDSSKIDAVYYQTTGKDTQPDSTKWTKIVTQNSWQIPLEKLSQGEQVLHLKVVDELGNRNDKVTSVSFTVDTEKPSISVDKDAGKTYYTKDGITVSGTAEDAISLKQVDIKLGATTLATIKASEIGEDNEWSYEIKADSLAADIATNVIISAVDNAGHVANANVFNVYKDTKAPTLVLNNIATGTETGTIITEQELRNNQFTVKGSWNDNGGSGYAKLEYCLDAEISDSTKWREVKVNNAVPEATWNFPITLETETLNQTLNIRVTDTVGNSSVTSLNNIIVDKSAPKAGTTSLDNQYIGKDGSYKLEGSATDTLGLAKIEIKSFKNGEEQQTDVITVPNGEKSYSWSKVLEPTSDLETWSYSIIAYDTAERTSVVETRTVFVDKKAPEFGETKITTAKAYGEWYNDNVLSIEGTLTEDTGIKELQFSTDKSTWTNFYREQNDTSYTFSGTISINEEWKNKTIYIKAVDTLGNESTAEITGINVDRNNPTVKINESIVYVNASTESLSISVEPSDDSGSGVKDVRAKINDGSYGSEITTGTNGTYTIPLNVAFLKDEKTPAAGTITVEVIDNVGKTGYATVQYEKDIVLPTVAITSHSDGDIVNKTIILKGSTTESQGLATVDLYVNGNLIKPVDKPDLEHTFIGNAGFNWEYKIDTTGYYNGTGTQDLPIKVVATDNAGNESEAQKITLKIDQKSDRPEITVRDIGLFEEKQYLGQKTISFTVEDDDGPIEKFEISEDNSNWNPVELKNGSYNYTLVDDGDYELSFRVTEHKENPESPDVVFETSSENNALTEPVLKYETEVSDSTLKFTLDTKNPEIKPGSTISFDEGTSSKFDNGIKIGGAKKAFTINVGVKDASGIQAVVLKVGENFTKEGSLQPGAADENGFETWVITISETECKDFDNGNVQFDLEVKDNAGSPTKVTKVLLVDNEKPSITVESPTNMTQVTSSVRISGSTTDDVNEDKDVTSSGISSVKYLITELTNVYDGSTLKSDDKITNLSEWQDVNGTNYWNFSINVDDYVKKENDEWTSYFAFEKGNDIFELPIFFLITDNVGNQHLEKGYTLLLDPEGDKPVASITYPTDGAILGGQIRVFGTADDNINVTNVYMQIDVNDNGADVVDKTWLADKTKTENGELKNLYNIVELSDGDWGIKLNGTSSWNLLINTTDEFTNASIEKISLRVKAFDGEKYGNWTDWIDITIDGEAPKIGSHVPPRLVQYENGTEIASVQYVADMWISGDWYLETSVMDNEGIGSIEIKESNFNDLKDISILGNPEYSKEYIENSDSGYIIKLPLKTSGKTEGNISFKISAIEKSDQNITSTYPISIKYDNSAPTLDGKLYSSKQEIGLGEGKNTIQDSDGQYEISTTVKEAGSGFQRLAVYFVREDSAGNKRIYNPRYAKETNGNKDNISEVGEGEGKVSGNVYIDEKDGLPRLYINNATIKDGSIISYPDLGENPNIYEGRIVRIKGVDRKITSISGDEATFTPEISAGYNADNVEAEFAYALIVDNFMKDNTDEATQDGDYIEETIIKTGEKYDCSLIFNSKNIPDGPITICYVAYDEAGNCSVKESVSTKIENNPPAIAKVWLGTDLNGDTYITEDEEVTVYGDNYDPETFDPLATKNRNISIDATTKFTAKDKTTIRADIVGGNNALYYYFGDYSKTEEIEIENVFENHKAKELSKLENGNYRITLTSDDLKSFDNNTGDFFVEYWDATEETKYKESDKSQNTSQSAKMEVKFKVDVVDTELPTVKIDDLYWNSKSDNSIVKTEKGENDGHIDLKGDLPSENFNADSGVFDRDDKVSGKIIFKGTVSDNVRLSKLNFTFEKEETEDKTDPYIAESLIYNSGEKKWSVLKDGYELELENQCVLKDGYELKLDNSTLDQNGHNVTWTLTIDTEKNGIVAAADVNLVVEAVDYSTNNASESKRVDVVPYITGVKTWLVGELKTSLQDAYSRTALGHYIIAEQEGNIEVTGFNLDDDAKKIDSKTATTGAYSVKVNGIESLNNLNNNNAKGSYTDSITEESSYEIKNKYAYNRLANGRTNNLLTDDIIFDVWEFDSDAAIPESGKLSEPVMKINPVTGKVGFAFVSGPAHFAMGGGTGNSYQTYQRNYATFTNVAMAYDEKGNSYGVTTGLDTFPQQAEDTYAGRFTFMTSKWGVGNLNDALDNYLSKNKIRFEAIGVQGNKKCYVKGLYPDTYTMTEFRFASPSMAVTTHGEDGEYATVYLAYYDDIQDQIRFRYGTVAATRESFGNFVDNKGVSYDYKDNDGGGWNGNNFRYVFESDTANFSLIAGADWQKNNTTGAGTGYTKKVENNYFYDTGYEADAYVAIDVVKGTSAEKNVVVAVWYDGKDCYYAYNTSPHSGKDNGPEGGWTTKKIFSGGGEYCTIKVDSSEGIHIAANVDGSLKYAYLSSYDASYTEKEQAIKIDSCAITGEQITIDVGKKTIGNKTHEIPYISYYMSASKKPCIAYITENAISTDGSMNYAAAGTDQNDCFTGNWEVSVIPAQSQLSGGHSDKINVGLWKDASGNIVSSSNDIFTAKNQSNENNKSETDSGNCYGNGTTNPIFGYAVKSTSGTCIETAQLK